jgi:hypothetical protein
MATSAGAFLIGEAPRLYTVAIRRHYIAHTRQSPRYDLSRNNFKLPAGKTSFPILWDSLIITLHLTTNISHRAACLYP